jgi:hypothetical protein
MFAQNLCRLCEWSIVLNVSGDLPDIVAVRLSEPYKPSQLFIIGVRSLRSQDTPRDLTHEMPLAVLDIVFSIRKRLEIHCAAARTGHLVARDLDARHIALDGEEARAAAISIPMAALGADKRHACCYH